MELITNRLKLKPTTEKDFDVLFEICTESSVRKYLFDGEVLSEADLNALLSTSISSFSARAYGLWLIEDLGSASIIGFAGLWHFFEENQPQLLYALLPKYTGRGFATEAASAIKNYSFHNLGFSYLTASCDRPNKASHSVAERVGMKKYKEETIDGKPLIFYKTERD